MSSSADGGQPQVGQPQGANLQEVPATTGVTIRFLWAMTWLNFVFAIVPILITGILVAGLFVVMGRADLANPMARVATWLVGLVVAVPVTQSLFGKRFGKYRIVVVQADENDPG
jgi:hypothetical protein